MNTDPLLKSAETRRRCGGISQMTLYRWEKEGILTPIKIRGKKYHRESEVKKIMEAGAGVEK
jgi:predicted site-specific integrase-resolvase